MPTERYIVVKVALPDGCDQSPTEALNSLVEDHRMEWGEDIGEWTVEGEYDSLDEIGESLFDIDSAAGIVLTSGVGDASQWRLP